ncbi:23S rRNA (pseudouridine(1915)-N(3))-methyltransferase RlmH [Pelagibius litoralis]|uniref:Ribosomal RNA large subunit methyltransferase H n=1 Tax=Pelagibius litoralis TaxID=374515 RepID=A0A967C6C1_9PROT|nr:23S rRNA (pseudouridine(1915)-N(3))-methyltransferase RlmH [Pelagibius litoralis]NIA68291.1 23S rRNA (pseudouridine(1915)-N(3))-methyltransferase RlmH [Pelagibius litoralis]
MRITLAAVGKAKAGVARELYDHYGARLRWPLALKEVEERRPLKPEILKENEGELLLAALPRDARVIALDEGGKDFSSRDFATLLGRWRDEGVQDLAFMIGGADGLSKAARQAADVTLCLGRMTWPHMLVRGLLAEQLFRAESILSGHPYHRD